MRRIYLLSPRELSPETIAVTFAKTSRSPESFRDIAEELSDEKSAQFHEKWVVGYGHASVAEHAVLHLAIENVSRLAIECIESNRLASYTEKSTRYQKWDMDAFVLPPELENHPLRNRYEETIRRLFRTYAESLAPARELIRRRVPRKEGESDAAWDRRIRSRYVDSCRYLLPAASLANVGMTANARVLEHAIRKMLSHPLEEVRQIGEEIKIAARRETPTLVKYAEPSPYLVETRRAFLSPLDSHASGARVSMTGYDAEGEKKILAAALFRFGGMSYPRARARIENASEEELDALADSLLGARAPHDIPLRELEYSTYTFEAVLDQGAYFEFKRHRMMTQTPQRLSTRLGYAVPRLLAEAGLADAYRAAMDSAAETYEALAEDFPFAASYVVPNGFYRRVLFTLNLREAYHLCELRAAPNAHFAIRILARRVADSIRSVHPRLARFFRLPEDETPESIEAAYFTDI